VAQALSANDDQWAKRDGGTVRLPRDTSLRQYWPPKRLLMVQQQFFELKLSERHAHMLDKPHECPVCKLALRHEGPGIPAAQAELQWAPQAGGPPHAGQDERGGAQEENMKPTFRLCLSCSLA